jgi:hypothetical protein
VDFIPLTANPNDLAQLEADKARFQQRQALAQSLMGAQYVPNSGGMGVLTSALSSLAGAFMNRRNNESMADLMRREFDTQNKAAIAKRQQELADEERKFNEELKKIDYTAKSKRDNAEKQFTGGGVFDPVSGAFTPSQEWTNQQLGLKRAEAAISASNRQDPNAGLMAKIALAKQLGADPQAIMAMVTGQQGAPDTQVVGNNLVDKRTGKAMPIIGPDGKPMPAQQQPLTGEVKNKLALIDNAIANAQKYQSRVAPGGGQFNDIDSQMGDTPELMKSAIQDMLYAKSGASAPVEEVRKANEMYGPSRLHLPLFGETPIPTERDSTSAAKVQNFLNDMHRMREQIAGSQGQDQQAPQAQASQAQPTQTAVNPQTGQRIGLVNGQWVPL